MAGFLDWRVVKESLDLLRETGKVKAAVLTLNDGSGTTQSYSYTYLEPVTEQSALGGSGSATQSATLVLYQFAETYTPRADDKVVQSGSSTAWLINSVDTQRNATSGYAVHTCRVTTQA